MNGIPNLAKISPQIVLLSYVTFPLGEDQPHKVANTGCTKLDPSIESNFVFCNPIIFQTVAGISFTKVYVNLSDIPYFLGEYNSILAPLITVRLYDANNLFAASWA
jgi:hypothetical protein